MEPPAKHDTYSMAKLLFVVACVPSVFINYVFVNNTVKTVKQNEFCFTVFTNKHVLGEFSSIDHPGKVNQGRRFHAEITVHTRCF
jgi:hypothetical protein